MFSLLPSVATHGQSVVQNLLPFLKWLLAPIVEPNQIAAMVKQFQPETVVKQNHLLWDMDNNCIQQEEKHATRLPHLQPYLSNNKATNSSNKGNTSSKPMNEHTF